MVILQVRALYGVQKFRLVLKCLQKFLSSLFETHQSTKVMGKADGTKAKLHRCIFTFKYLC